MGLANDCPRRHTLASIVAGQSAARLHCPCSTSLPNRWLSVRGALSVLRSGYEPRANRVLVPVPDVHVSSGLADSRVLLCSRSLRLEVLQASRNDRWRSLLLLS